MTKLFFTVAAVLCAAAVFADFAPLPDFFTGINQVAIDEYSPERPLNLTDREMKEFRSRGVNTIRIPLYPTALGFEDNFYIAPPETFDRKAAESVQIDWRRLDGFLDLCLANGITPFICPYAYHYFTLYIPEDRESAEWFTLLVVRHITEKYGTNVVYGYHENIWRNAHFPWHTGDFRFAQYPGFLKAYRERLKDKYNTIGKLNKAYKTDFASFDEVTLPDLGSVERGTPMSACSNIRTYDLRYFIDIMYREAVTEIAAEIKKIAPGCIWAGAVYHNSFEGMGQVRGGAPPCCNPSISTMALTGDVLCADSYDQKGRFTGFYRTVAKYAYLNNKPWLAAEINSQSADSMKWMKQLGGHNVGTLIWDGLDVNEYALMTREEGMRASMDYVEELFRDTDMSRKNYSSYTPGKLYLYFPEESYEYMVSWENYLDEYCSAFEYVPDPKLIEPVTTKELLTLDKNHEIYVLENNLPKAVIDNLFSRGDKFICPHRIFTDEYGKKHTRPSFDFDRILFRSEYGSMLKPLFAQIEIKENNRAKPELGAVISSSCRLMPIDDELHGKGLPNLIDGDMLASRIILDDVPQQEEIIIKLGKSEKVYGAFAVTDHRDWGRVPHEINIWVSDNGTVWKQVYASKESVTKDMNDVYFPAVRCRYVKFDFGIPSDTTGTRLMELGVLGK